MAISIIEGLGFWFPMEFRQDIWAFHIFASSQNDERPKANTPQIALEVFFRGDGPLSSALNQKKTCTMKPSPIRRLCNLSYSLQG